MNKIISKDNKFNMYELDSKSELITMIEIKCGIFVGQQAENVKKYYLLEYDLTNRKYIGIHNEGHGILPVIKCNQYNNKIYIASDNYLYIINSNENRLLKTIISNSLIYEIFYEIKFNRIFLICEIGITCCNSNGEIIWVYDSELIVNYEINSQSIIIIEEEITYEISYENGKFIKYLH